MIMDGGQQNNRIADYSCMRENAILNSLPKQSSIFSIEARFSGHD